MLAGFSNGTVAVYDPSNENSQRLEGVAQAGISFSAVSFRGHFVISGAEGTPMLWTSSTNETAAIEFVDTTVQHVAFDPSGTRVGFVGDDNTVHIKSATDGAEIATLSHSGCDKIQFSEDGRQIATMASSGTWFGETRFIVWDCETGEALTPELRQEILITSAAFYPDGETLLTAGTDETILMWNVDKAAVENQIYHLGHVMQVHFDRAGERVLSAGGLRREGHAQVVNIQSRIRRIAVGEHLPARISSDGTKILTIPQPDSVELRSIASGLEAPITLKHSEPIVWADLSADGGRLRTATANEIFLWPEAPQTIADCAVTSYSGRIACMVESPTDPAVVCALGESFEDGEPVGGVYSLQSMQDPAKTRPMGPAHGFYDVVSSPNGMVLSGSGNDPKVRLWKSGGANPDFLHHEAGVRLVLDVEISGDSSGLASAVAEWTGGDMCSCGTFRLTSESVSHCVRLATHYMLL